MQEDSFANEESVCELVDEITRYLKEQRSGDTNKNWTTAIWRFFRKFAENKRWKLYPESQPYKGEYLVDFILFEDDYGPRIACESQWSHWRRDPKESIDWAFDKLRGVKADVKLLLYEWERKPDDGNPDEPIRKIFTSYLSNNALITNSEAFAFIQYDGDTPYAYWWKPTRSGRHSEYEVNFKKIKLR